MDDKITEITLSTGDRIAKLAEAIRALVDILWDADHLIASDRDGLLNMLVDVCAPTPPVTPEPSNDELAELLWNAISGRGKFGFLAGTTKRDWGVCARVVYDLGRARALPSIAPAAGEGDDSLHVLSSVMAALDMYGGGGLKEVLGVIGRLRRERDALQSKLDDAVGARHMEASRLKLRARERDAAVATVERILAALRSRASWLDSLEAAESAAKEPAT